MLLTAMVTPFHADGSLDLDGAQRLAAHLVDDLRHDGLVRFQPQDDVRVLLDPAGHPFCLYKGSD